MSATPRIAFAALAALVLAAPGAWAQPKEKKEPKKEAKKEPGKAAPKKLEIVEREIVYVVPPGYMPGIAYGWNYYWPGPVLPGMYGNAWGGMWPYSWWMGGPWALSAGWNSSGYWNSWHFHGGGIQPVMLPPVFGPVRYPAVSPFWAPYVAPYWFVPAPAFPVIVGSAKPAEYRAVPTGASFDKLYADAMWLFSDENYKSARDHFAAAIAQNPKDARVWYFKALSERAMNNNAAASESAANGVALEITGVADKKTILASLERIQGPDRVFLTDKLNGANAMSVETAKNLVAKLNDMPTTVVSTSK